MQKETSNTSFLSYGSVYKKMDEQLRAQLVCQNHRISSQRTLTQFSQYSCDTYLEVQEGLGVLLVSTDPDTAPIENFSMNHRVHIKPNIFFCIMAATPEVVVDIYSDSTYSLDIITLSTPYEVQPVLPRIQVPDILGYFYRVRTPGYQFTGERHNYFELTYVDTGVMHTEVDGIGYTLHEKEMILYGPGQFHKQTADETHSISYVTILFDMENVTPGIPADWYESLLNRIFPYTPKIYSLMKTLVQESTSALPYMDSLMECLVTELIIRLLQGEYTSSAAPASLARQNYRDELFQKVLSYVESKMYEPLTIADICQEFSLSRSSLQLLFKNTVNQSPKKYISDMKLERSCQMLRENKYTVSEIALKLGYSSIHYFSNAFNQKYHVSPSEYAKRIY
jgi:AraC-like DNA-binding protein